MSGLLDQRQRPLRDLRISITDRCNFRCPYCMPSEVYGRDFRFLAPSALLSFEEIRRVTGVFLELGVGKVRITGGEPLLRRDVETLISMIASLPGLHDLTLTTNGSLLAEKVHALRGAGLKRITVSLDSLDDEIFRRMNDVDVGVGRIVAGIEAAIAAGFSPVKVNMVVRRGVNESSVLEMARRFRSRHTILRFIEYMDVGTTNGWRLDDVVPAAEILRTIDQRWPLEAIESTYSGEVARRYRYRDGGGEIGLVSSVTQPFCSDCTRARLSSEGMLYTCLFAHEGHDLRALLRSGRTDDELSQYIRGIWGGREDRYSEQRTSTTEFRQKVEMSRIGG